MSCLLPIKLISISFLGLFPSLIQTSSPIQFSTPREKLHGLIHSQRPKWPSRNDKLRALIKGHKQRGPQTLFFIQRDFDTVHFLSLSSYQCLLSSCFCFCFTYPNNGLVEKNGFIIPQLNTQNLT